MRTSFFALFIVFTFIGCGNYQNSAPVNVQPPSSETKAHSSPKPNLTDFFGEPNALGKWANMWNKDKILWEKIATLFQIENIGKYKAIYDSQEPMRVSISEVKTYLSEKDTKEGRKNLKQVSVNLIADEDRLARIWDSLPVLTPPKLEKRLEQLAVDFFTHIKLAQHYAENPTQKHIDALEETVRSALSFYEEAILQASKNKWTFRSKQAYAASQADNSLLINPSTLAGFGVGAFFARMLKNKLFMGAVGAGIAFTINPAIGAVGLGGLVGVVTAEGVKQALDNEWVQTTLSAMVAVITKFVYREVLIITWLIKNLNAPVPDELTMAKFWNNFQALNEASPQDLKSRGAFVTGELEKKLRGPLCQILLEKPQPQIP